jgi:hypothetical protein
MGRAWPSPFFIHSPSIKMKKIVLAACLALSFAVPSSYAQSAAPVDAATAAAVQDLLDAMHYRDTMQQTVTQMQKNMPAMMMQGAAAAIRNNKSMTDAQKNDAMAKANKEIPQAVAAMDATFKDPALMDELVAEFIPLYARHFTAAEIRDMAAYYRTPVGAKMIRLMPQIAGESMQISQKVLMPRLNAAIEKVVKPK